jgi:hypothetical protein
MDVSLVEVHPVKERERINARPIEEERLLTRDAWELLPEKGSLIANAVTLVIARARQRDSELAVDVREG